VTGSSLEGQCAIVTGAGRGLGRGIALAFANEGASVACIGRTMATIEETAHLLTARNVASMAVRCDVTSRAQVFAAVERVAERFGAIDILVNNAMDLHHLPIPEITEAELDRAIRSSLYGSLFFMQACFPYLKEAKGAVVNFASAGGTEGWPGQAAYSAAKEAVRGLTKSAAAEWGPLGITVNVVAPMGFSDAFGAWYEDLSEEEKARYIEGVPLRRIGDAETDIGSVVAFLASRGGSYITGRTIFVDGGRSFYDR
jgi:NAD(P)-dependent dehydrogenase (short-subunit alcohol dehydrogenase family)